MPNRFFPKAADGQTYTLTRLASDRFEAEKADLIHDVARKMAVEYVEDAGRVPSPFSRAYSFYTDLFPDEFALAGAEKRAGRDEAQKRARREFRGLVSVLALRELLQINIAFKSFNPAAAVVGERNPFRDVFKGAYAEAPGFKDHPAWSDFQYLVVVTETEAGTPIEEPLCGLSPYTLVYPAAFRLQSCRAIFWYDANKPKSSESLRAEGRWRDPTMDWGARPADGLPMVSYEIIKILRGYVCRWLDQVLAADPTLVWQEYGLTLNRTVKLRDELQLWRGDLDGVERIAPPEGTSVGSVALGILRGPDGQPISISIPVLEQQVTLPKVEGRVLTELPRVRGRVLLSESIVSDPNIRVYGALMGNPRLKASLARLTEAEGDEFTLIDGDSRYRIQEPYLYVDRMFFDSIHLLSDARLTKYFLGLDTSSQIEPEYWMFPFRPALLQYLDLARLFREADRRSQVSVVRRAEGGGEVVQVEVMVGGKKFSRQYAEKRRIKEVTAEDFEIRIWPNIRFSVAPRVPLKDEDRAYHIRVRQDPGWNLDTHVIARKNQAVSAAFQDEIGVFVMEMAEVGWRTDGLPEPYRRAKCGVFNTTRPIRVDDGQPARGDWEPLGLYFEGRGLCLLNLPKPAPPGADPVRWRVGVDFGTSNTCVTFTELKTGQAVARNAIRFEMQTATLNETPKYADLEAQPDHEGAAAVLDFPYLYRNPCPYLTDRSFFPSLLVTRENTAQPKNANFRLATGLIFPRNVILDNKDIGSLLKDNPPSPSPDRRVFRLISDTKWGNEIYRKTFLWHLYRMIVYEAARHGAVVTEAAFSHPRAFDENKIRGYCNEVIAIFEQHGGISVSRPDFITESEAVQRWLVAHPDAHDHLVLDVGGGTTDYLAVFGNQALFQTSYYFAAGYVNEYVAASPILQQAMQRAITLTVGERPDPEERNIQTEQRNLLRHLLASVSNLSRESLGDLKNYCQQAFFGMLSMMEDEHYAPVVTELFRERLGNRQEQEQRAVRGFFYTLVLLYTGVVYQAGRLMGQQKVSSSNLEIDFIGNGSRFYRFLNHRMCQFDPVLQKVFQAGMSGTARLHTDMLPDGKSFVAKGLLVTAGATGGRIEPAPVVPDQASMDYLRTLANRNPQDRTYDTSDLATFIKVLNEQLPGGRLERVLVIPFVVNLEAELTGLFPRMQERVRRYERESLARLQYNEAEAAQLRDSNEKEAKAFTEAALATEPVFISRLRCLLDAIRDEYAS